MRVEFAFGMASIGAFAHAGLLRVQGSSAYVWIVGFIGGLIPQVVKLGLRDGTAAHVFAIVGAMALCAAAFIDHHTLTRSTSSSKAYRRPAMALGMRLRSSN